MAADTTKEMDVHSSKTIVLSDDGGWCWFESPGTLQQGPLLLIGSVASGGNDENRRGNIELHIHDCSTHLTKHVILHKQLELDDHDGPALLVRPDNRLLVLYAKHGTEPYNYSRISLNKWDRSYQQDEILYSCVNKTSHPMVVNQFNIFLLC